MAAGPIPASAIDRKALEMELEPDVARAFRIVIRTLDRVYLEHQRAESERLSKRRGRRGGGGFEDGGEAEGG